MPKAQKRIYSELTVIRSQQREPEAFEDLVEYWNRPLWNHCYRLTEREETAWDITQETWMSVLKGLPRLKDPAAFPKWIYQIASNKCRDWIRDQQQKRTMKTEYQKTLQNEKREYENHEKEQQESLDVALNQLPGQQRALLSLYYLEEFSIKEISEILEIPEGTVKSRLYHARNQLRNHMEENS